MICVSIGRGRHKMLMAEHAHAGRIGAELVELRIDYVLRTINLIRVTENRPTQTIITCRRPADGGKWRGNESDRIILLRSAITTGVEYVDLEEDIADEIKRFGNTKRIISYHNLRETPENLEEIHASMQNKDADIIKIATYANSPNDNLRVLNLIKNSPIPTIAFCMGELGAISRIICRKFGAPFSYAALSSERSVAPGQFTYQEMKKLYRFDKINSNTSFLGVIADPVGHSLSPTMHNELLEKDGINKVYLPIRVPAEHLDEFMDCVSEFGITGLSVTIPHKESVLRFVNGLDEDTAGIRAANTIVFKDKTVDAFNTDCKAAMLSLAHEEGKFNADLPFKGRRALVLGSGGAAKAMTYGLKTGGANVLISGRNTKTTEKMCVDMKCTPIDWAARHDVEVDYIINCTPAGMHPDLNSTPYDVERLTAHTLVFDTVYTPQQTLLIKGAQAKGCRTITGADMFVRQAAMQYKLFTSRDPNVAEMKRIFLESINPARYNNPASNQKKSSPDNAGTKPDSSPDSNPLSKEIKAK
ncbi:MAG: shikimate dehydrogenase [Planctomycetota bacterium]|nr:shikimate dehydrogenase [Planctomycetota bacterium]